MSTTSAYLELAGRRFLVFGATVATAAVATEAMVSLLEWDGIGPLEMAYLFIFAALFLWIGLSFWNAFAGFLAMLLRLPQRGLQEPAADAPLATRTAILFPVYNEPPDDVFARLAAMHEGLAATGLGAAFDFFVLSDSTKPAYWIAEEQAWLRSRQTLRGGGEIYYRRRGENREKKAGNIADFCRRWGGAYECMIVMDADSLMTAEAMIRLARTMEANPRVGLIQVPPTLINRNSLFARFQQFASALATPILAHGLTFWQGGQGNYWGHNAIIRVRAFTESCGLPTLPGTRPFGGHILSHDFVEAALLCRHGWEVRMAPDLGGSYEESPPTVVEYAARDRRWCQGNLQHLRVLVSRDIPLVSRVHMAMGVMSYVASPLWLLFLLVGLMGAALESLRDPVPLPPNLLLPFGASRPQDAAMVLFVLAAGMGIAPRLFGLAAALLTPRARGFGGRFAVTCSTLVELLFSALLAPAMMLLHSRFVYEAASGVDSGWGAQQRGEGDMGLRVAFRAHAVHVLVGVLLLLLLPLLPDSLGWWFAPLAGALVITPLLTWISASRRLGLAFRRARLLLVPEEVEEPAILRRTNARLASGGAGVPPTALGALAADRPLRALHKALLLEAREPTPHAGLVEPALEKLRHGQTLSAQEETALLSDIGALDRAVSLLSGFPAAGHSAAVPLSPAAE